MRPSTFLPYGLALFFPVLGACGPGVETAPTGGGGGTGGATGGGGTTTTTTGGGGTGGATGGTGGVGGTAGAGGFMPPANDACDGEPIAVTVDAPATTVTGTLNGATDNYGTFCADTTNEPDFVDVVYELDVPSDVTATIKITAAGFNPAISLRRQVCNDRLGGDPCFLGDSGTLETTVAISPGKAWLVIDSADGQTGNFDLDVAFASPACGDGVLNPGEACDPAAPINGDGCFNPGTATECTFGEPPPDPALVDCPGGLITIGKGDSFPLSLYNNGSGGKNHQNLTDAVSCTSAAMGPENVFNLNPTADGMLTVQIGYDEGGSTLYCDTYPNDCGDFIMYLRKNACNSTAAADQLACTDYTPTSNPPYFYDEVLTLNVPVTGGTDYWLFVDGLDDMYGIGGYYLTVSLQ
jgi:cysteine-rich repeat protein